MYINKIAIQNFKSIYDTLIIDFDADFKGFWKIEGPIGSGKTTIGEAILFGLFGSVAGKTNNSLISWGKKHGLVEMWLKSNGHNIYIKREMNIYGQSPVYVEIDGQEMTYTDKRTAQATLEEEYYDTSKTALELLCIISFNNFKSLVTLNAKDSRQFLDQVLGISSLAPYIETVREIIAEVSASIQSSKNNINSLEAQIIKIKEIQNKSIIPGDINETRDNIDLLKKNINEIQDKYKKDTSDTQELIRQLSMSLASIKMKGQVIAKDIKFIEGRTCPTCGSKIDQSKLPEKITEKNNLLEEYKNLNNNIIDKQKKLDIIRKNLETELQTPKQELEKLNTLLIKLIEQSKRMNINKEEIEMLEAELSNKKIELNELYTNMVQWEELNRILTNDVKQYIISSFIPALNQNIDTFAKRLMLPYSINFDNNFKCTITLSEFSNEIPVSSLSTGQLKIVDMITILGVLGTVMGQGSLNIMFLDELFSNLNSDAGNEVCDLLKEFVDPANSVFIISHAKIDDRGFDGVINLKLCKDNEYYHTCYEVERFVKDM